VDCAPFKAQRSFWVGICFPETLCPSPHCIFSYVTIVAEGEAIALQVAVHLAVDNGYECVIFESDCQSVINN